MTEDQSSQNKKSNWIMGVVLVLLALVTIFVFLDNKYNRLHPLNPSPMVGNLEILVVLISLTLVGVGGVYGFLTYGKVSQNLFHTILACAWWLQAIW